MSGSAALASARRRRVNSVEQVSNVPQKQPTQTPQPNNDKVLVSPLTIMKHHHNEILAMKEQINQLKNNTDNMLSLIHI